MTSTRSNLPLEAGAKAAADAIRVAAMTDFMVTTTKGFGMVEEEECGREAGPGGAREKKGSRARERGKGNNSNKQIGILVGFDSSC